MVDTKRSSLAEGNRGPGLTADAAALVRAETLRTLAKFGIAVLLANGGILWGIYTGVESNLTERFESSLAERIDDAISAKQVVVDQLQRQVLDNVILAATETGAAIGRAEELRNSIAAFSNDILGLKEWLGTQANKHLRWRVIYERFMSDGKDIESWEDTRLTRKQQT